MYCYSENDSARSNVNDSSDTSTYNGVLKMTTAQIKTIMIMQTDIRL